MSRSLLVRRRCFAGMIVVVVALLGALAPGALAKPHTPVGPVPTVTTATAAVHGPHLGVSALSSAPAGASAGHSYVLRGTVANAGTTAAAGPMTVRLLRFGHAPVLVGRIPVDVRAHSVRSYRAKVTVPKGLDHGSYMLAACTRRAGASGSLGCATARRSFDVGVATPVRGAKVAAASMSRRDDETCSSGAHTLSHFGDHVYPEMGNGGYTSLHTDVNLIYNAVENEFLEGTNVVLTDSATQCLSDFSLDFAPQTPDNEEGPGANMQVQKVLVNGEPAEFEFVQPTYPGDPNGQNDPDPAAHQTGQDTPVSATNPLPPACTPEESATAANGQPCPARKLVITPSAPIPAGEHFEIEVEYDGHPGLYTDGGGEGDGWFRSNSPAGDGAFVTTEPVGTEAWMPLNNHPSAKPTYDFNEKVTKGRTVVANGVLVGSEENEPDAQFPEGSTTWRWHSPETIANYLVENSIGAYDLSERLGGDGILYYEAQGSSLSATQKAKNKAVMDQQEDITHFQERFNGPFPLASDGVVVGIPNASFEEEMQGKITFNGGQIALSTFNHENMHQWWGDNVSESNFNETFFKEGMAKLSEFLLTARTAATAAGGLDTPAGEAAFDASLVARFHTNYIVTGTMWTRAPSNPTAVTLFSQPTTYTRPATAYIALRQILGKGNFTNAMKQIQQEFGGGSIHESQLEGVFREAMPNQSPACRSRLNQFFSEWFDTEFAATGSATAIRPQLTGPGLDTSASGTTFYNADGTCKRVAPAPPVTTAAILPAPAEGKVIGPATITLTAKDANSGVASTEFKLDGAKNFSVYNGPIVVSALGAHTLEFRSTNRDGAVEATKLVAFTVVAHDPPVTSASVSPNPVEGKVTGPATVTLSATENGGGVAKTEFKVDGGAFQEYTGPFTVSGFADHTVEYRSTNRDGVIEATKSVTFIVVPHDAPVTSASIRPKPDQVTNNIVGPATVTLAATENGGGIASTEFSVDGGPFETYEEPFTVEGFSDHTVEYRSTNRDGVVEGTKQVAFTIVAHDAPVTTASVLPEPVDGTVTGGPAKVVLAATDLGVDVTGTEFNLDGGGFQPYVEPITVAGFGAHTVEFRSTNADDVVEATKQVTFTIVRHDAPSTAASVLPEPVDSKVTGPAKVVLAPTDHGGGIASTEFKLDGGAFQPYAGPIAVSSFGAHTVQFRSTNGDGAIEATKQVTFTIVAHDAPVTSASILPVPVGGEVTGSATVVLAATENGGGVAGTEFKLDSGAFQPYVGPITISTLGEHTIKYRSTNRDGVAEGVKQIKFMVVAPPLPPLPPAPPAPKPVCAEPHLTIAVSHPLSHSKGLVTLRQGKAYRYTGRLTCGPAGTPAPEGTVISVASIVGGHTSAQPGIAVGGEGKIDTLLLFSGKRTVVFGFASNGASTQASVRIAVVRH